MIVQGFKNYNIYLLCGALSGLLGCASRANRSKLNNLVEVEKEQQSPTITIKRFSLLDASNIKIQASKLQLFRASIAKVETPSGLIPMLQFGVDPQIDYVQWWLCPIKGHKPCDSGKTKLNKVFLTVNDPGQFDVRIRPCVEVIRAENPNHKCGVSEHFTWWQRESANKTHNKAIERQNKINQFAAQLSQVLINLKKTRVQCKKDGAVIKNASQTKTQIEDDVAFQLENLITMGEHFFVGALEHHLANSLDENSLAQVLTVDETTLEQDSSYIPDGFALSTNQTKKITGEALIHKLVQAHSGLRLENPTKTQLNIVLNTLPEFKRKAVMSFLALKADNSTKGMSLAVALQLDSILALGQNGLQLQGSGLECRGYQGALDALNQLRNQIYLFKEADQ